LPPLPAVAPRLIAPPQVAKTIGMQIRGLLQENVGLQDARQEQSKQYEEVVRENQRLQEKIRNLERIFIDDHRHDAMTFVGLRPATHDRRAAEADPEPAQGGAPSMAELLALRRSNLQLRAELEAARAATGATSGRGPV
ncbi:hypothetical protein PBRA_008771, partial [Plasmodiophora brassicae]